MKKNIYYSLLISAMVSVSAAEETRQVDKHEHGVGELNIAIEGNAIDFEFFIPGADIVGFEYEAKTESDIALVNAALEKFGNFDNIFSLPESSNCNLVNSEIGVNQDDDHDDHDEHDDHDDHDEHDEHDDHDDHDEHDEHDDHDEHDEEAHNEFVAHYSFNCGNIKEIDRISFPYFTTFPNSGELEVQFVSEIGSTSFEVEGDEPFIDLKGKI